MYLTDKAWEAYQSKGGKSKRADLERQAVRFGLTIMAVGEESGRARGNKTPAVQRKAGGGKHDVQLPSDKQSTGSSGSKDKGTT